MIISERIWWVFDEHLDKSSDIGIIFWIVDRIKHNIQDNEAITAGNQKWNGAIPSFIKSLDITRIEEKEIIL